MCAANDRRCDRCDKVGNRDMAATDPSFRYTWLMWAAAFMLPWVLVFVVQPALRRPMVWASVLTAPFGLTEPLFVPAYWNPPSLFDLAQRTGFDIESLIFCFAIGGLGVAGYRALVPVRLYRLDRHLRRVVGMASGRIADRGTPVWRRLWRLLEQRLRASHLAPTGAAEYASLHN